MEQENALQEIVQQYILASLSRAGLFAEAIFHGGTCLRIVHAINRFSQDLDFLLKKPDPRFVWQPYLERVQRDCAGEGIEFEIRDRSAAASAVRKAYLKTDSVGKVLTPGLPYRRHTRRKIRVKLEIDTNPPEGSGFETGYLSFPALAPLTVQSLSSGFATKAHALLCRTYTKGRDWYDLTWYAGRRIEPDFQLLANALSQQGPWKNERLEVTVPWFLGALREKIRTIDWAVARGDVQRFLPTSEQEGLQLWSEEFFLYQVDRMEGYLAG
ncbi:MAG: nucleotidyl transferase AbiEii/AbiGii toxin family protein [Gemmatimonadetes bacterium]|nr:nucleotidyl transferase AbiEii/AbiGii toxin family protein [Gemmatimonadota bacterium]